MHNNTTKQFPETILFTHYGDDWIRGSERCLLDLLKHLDTKSFTAILLCNQPTMEKAAQALGVKVYRSNFSLLFGWQAPYFDFKAYFAQIKQASALIKKHNVKLLHANSAAPCQWLTMVAKKQNIPLVCHMHSTYQLRDRLTLGLYQTDMTVGVSKYVVEPLIKDGKSSEQINVIANGIDSQRLLAQPVVNLRETLNINSGDFVIASLGSLIHRKGVDLLIESVEKLLKKEVNVHLVVIGDGPEKENLTQKIILHNLQNNVSLIGEKEDAVGILRGTADLFVSAAREEAFGLVFAEASLAGLAIVAPKVGGIPDVVIDQKTGLLVASESINDLVDSIYQLYCSPQRCIEMAQAGQLHIAKNFNIENNCQQFQFLYQKMIAQQTIKKLWHQKLTTRWSLFCSFFTALTNYYQRTVKGS